MAGVEGSATPLPRREFLRRAGLIVGGTVAVERQADLGFDVAQELPAPASPCTFGAKGGASSGDPFVDTTPAMNDLQDTRFKEASERPWSQAT